MNKVIRNYLLDIVLFSLLGVNIVSLVGAQEGLPAAASLVGLHAHILSGMLLTLGCLTHMALHWRWFQAVVTGRVKGGVKLIMNSMVTIMMLLACLSGFPAHVTNAASGFHAVVGSIALLGLFVHGAKHLRWMAAMTRKLIVTGEPGSASQLT